MIPKPDLEHASLRAIALWYRSITDLREKTQATDELPGRVRFSLGFELFRIEREDRVAEIRSRYPSWSQAVATQFVDEEYREQKAAEDKGIYIEATPEIIAAYKAERGLGPDDPPVLW